MKQILILGALPENKERKELYSSLADTCRKYADVVYTPIDTADFKGSGAEKYKRAFELVRTSDLIIGEQSEPSTGQGMEIRESTLLNKPFVVIARTGSKISGLVKEIPNLEGIMFYETIDDAKTKLGQYLKEI